LSYALEKWIHPFSRLHKIPVFKRVWLYLALMTAYTALVYWFVANIFATRFLKEAASIGFASLILGLLMVFRTNSAYERWWEGRKLWGQLVNESRNLCIKAKKYANVSNSEKVHLGQLVVSFAYSLMHHLRDKRPNDNLPGVRPIEELGSAHLPVQIAEAIYDKIQQWYKAQALDGFTLGQLDVHARALMDICGGCERIKSTPLALSYRAFIRQGIALNLLAMPWYSASTLAFWWSLPLIIVTSYFLIGLELIAEDIEDPFGKDGDDLPIEIICDKISQTVSEIISGSAADREIDQMILVRS
jgi:putative membrane protein